MRIETMILENNPSLIAFYDKCGVDRIFVDLELEGKVERQGHLDTVISCHTEADVAAAKSAIKNAKLLVRINPYSDRTKGEVDRVIGLGADILMLPMFTTEYEVRQFIKHVDGRAKCCLLLETPQAFVRLDDILSVPGIDEIHIGLNDLHLGLGLTFMFELLSSGMVEYIANKIKAKGILFGFGGVALMGAGDLPGRHIITEHARLGSSMVILSRAFKNNIQSTDFSAELNLLHSSYSNALNMSASEYAINMKTIKKFVRKIVGGNEYL